MKKIYENPNMRVHTMRERESICSASSDEPPHHPHHPWWPWGPPHPPGPHHSKSVDGDLEDEIGDE